MRQLFRWTSTHPVGPTVLAGLVLLAASCSQPPAALVCPDCGQVHGEADQRRWERDRLVAAEPDPARQVLLRLYGALSENQTARELPAPFWNPRARVFDVVNYTWPHTPSARVAWIDGDLGAFPMNALGDGLGDPNAPSRFNLVAHHAGGPVDDAAAPDYLRFALTCLIGGFDEDRWFADPQAARRHQAGEPAAGGWPGDTAVTHAEGEHRIVGHYDQHGTMYRVELAVRASDGQAHLDLRAVDAR